MLEIDEFKRLLNNSGLTVNQFANNLGVSRQMISYIIHGKRGMTQRISDKVREVFGYMLPV
jgi:plasmid maintenance system antidote protein VapI